MITTKGQKPKFKEENTMTDKHIKQIESQLPAGEQIIKMYKAFEGYQGHHHDKSGYEIRYLYLDENLNVTIKKF